MTKTTFLAIFLLVASLGLAACGNTFQGAGHDIEDAGKWVQDTF